MANKFHDFDEPINRIGTDSFKWDYEGENGKYIPLGVADTDFKAPEEAIAAVRKRTEFGVYAYGALPQERKDLQHQSVTGIKRDMVLLLTRKQSVIHRDS